MDTFGPHLTLERADGVGALQDGPISVEMLIGRFCATLDNFPIQDDMGVGMTLGPTNQNWSNYGFAKLSLR